ncbi:FUSC family protein [Clostridium sp. MSJ-11]|uniref:FUSC family protein n=1 Tax=Clostridium mobile TaxID=2841512 RepID=A0ABS6ED69_9CLOT|nr:aromatic acid exporter family protein [Clostridium mobile]MBU5483134.1 FUSC family protein [Clostridium mobile]
MKIGMRNIKTSISVVLCVILFELLNREYPFYACIAAVVTLQSSISDSFKAGQNRLIGTAIGATVGLIFSYLPQFNFWVHAVYIGLGICMVIYLCNIFNKNDSISISCIVFSAIMTNLKGVPSYIYVINRTVDTCIGIIISILVNKYFNFKFFNKFK